MESPPGDLGGLSLLCAQGDPVLALMEGICDPGQAGFSASLMLSQVPCDWIGTEVVFYSPVVLRSRGNSSRVPWGCLPTLRPGDPVLVPTGRAQSCFLSLRILHIAVLEPDLVTIIWTLCKSKTWNIVLFPLPEITNLYQEELHFGPVFEATVQG